MDFFKAIIFTFLVENVNFVQSVQHSAPVFEYSSSRPENIYHGLIKESEIEVHLSPAVRIIDGTGPVCKYLIYSGEDNSTSNQQDVPFEIEVVEQETGTLRMLVKPGKILDCTDPMYKFFIKAIRCSDESVSKEAKIQVKVEDTNDHEPEFLNDELVVSIEEDKVQKLAQLNALDRDCGYPYGEICRYEISNDSPEIRRLFRISQSGILKNLEPLNITNKNIYLLEISAYDCGMRRSSRPAVVTIKVEPSSNNRHSSSDEKISIVDVREPQIVNASCQPGLMRTPYSLEYYVGRGGLPLFSGVELNLCHNSLKNNSDTCGRDEHFRLEAKITLNADWRQNGAVRACDRENMALQSLKKVCGADSKTIELLPSQKDIKIENERNDPIVESQEASEIAEPDVFIFDGQKNAVIVPPAPEFQKQPNLTQIFTLNFWMKREKPQKFSDQTDRRHHYKKENILCLSDERRMSRHHFAIYTKNCKLEVLFRREMTDIFDKNGQPIFHHRKSKRSTNNVHTYYEPAEWRWQLDQVCDNNWHHYSFNVKFPEVNLYVDGLIVDNESKNAEILDDWPMHHINGMENRLVVGACWQGSTGEMVQHFRGLLSGLTVLPGKIEKPSVLECTLQCKERLEFFGLNMLKGGEEAIFNRDMSELTLKAKNAADLTELLRKISFLNSRPNPSFGDRFIRVIVTLQCDKSLPLPLLLPIVETKITVKKLPDAMSLSLTASKLVIDLPDMIALKSGVQLFPDLRIFVTDNQSNDTSIPLDFCKISTDTSLDKTREYFTSPAEIIGGSPSLDMEQISSGLLIKGRTESHNYEKILRNTLYFLSRPGEFPRRIFSVYCSAYGGRLESQKIVITLNVIKDDDKPKHLSPVVQDPLNSFHDIKSLKVPRSRNFYSKQNVKKVEVFVEPKFVTLNNEQDSTYGFDTIGSRIQNGAGPVVATVIVICVGFLILLMVFGLIKLRSSLHESYQRRPRDGGGNFTVIKSRSNSPDDVKSIKSKNICSNAMSCGLGSDLAWDDAGMTIIVNPIDGSKENKTKQCDDRYCTSASEDDESCEEDENEELDEHLSTLSDHDDDDDDDHVLPHLENVADDNRRYDSSHAIYNGIDSVVGTRLQHQHHQHQRVKGKASNVDINSLEWDDDAALKVNNHFRV